MRRSSGLFRVSRYRQCRGAATQPPGGLYVSTRIEFTRFRSCNRYGRRSLRSGLLRQGVALSDLTKRRCECCAVSDRRERWSWAPVHRRRRHWLWKVQPRSHRERPGRLYGRRATHDFSRRRVGQHGVVCASSRRFRAAGWTAGGRYLPTRGGWTVWFRSHARRRERDIGDLGRRIGRNARSLEWYQ
jgi:hypothetical protein